MEKRTLGRSNDEVTTLLGVSAPEAHPRPSFPTRVRQETPRQARDRHLLADVARGDMQAFSALYDQLSGPLYTLCLRMIGDPEESEDVLQEVFVALWRRASDYDAARGSVFGWTVLITRGKAIDHLRSRGRRLRVVVSTPDADDGDAHPSAPENGMEPGPDAADQAEAHDQAGRVRRVLGQLPSEQCQAIEMAFFGDLSHHEISARLGQPLGTIKARIRRGLLKLRDGLQRAS